MADLNFGVNLNPSGTQNLGSATQKWQSIYASTMYVDNTSSVVANNIQITDNGSSLNVPGAIYTTSAIAANDSSNRVATTSFVQAAVAANQGITELSNLTIGGATYNGTSSVTAPVFANGASGLVPGTNITSANNYLNPSGTWTQLHL